MEGLGWPPDGEPGLFLGYDADMNCSLLRWVVNDDEPGNWYGLRWQMDLEQPMPQAFRRGFDIMNFVVRWERVAPKAS